MNKVTGSNRVEESALYENSADKSDKACKLIDVTYRRTIETDEYYLGYEKEDGNIVYGKIERITVIITKYLVRFNSGSFICTETSSEEMTRDIHTGEVIEVKKDVSVVYG